MSVRVIDKTKEFGDKADRVLDATLALIAADIETDAKMHVPVLTGALQSSGKTERLKFQSHRVSFNKVYAKRREYEEAKQYSTPGTGSHYLSNAVTRSLQSWEQTMKRALEKVRVM